MPTAFRRTSSDLAADAISLTLAHVSAIPKRNNEQYIAMYLRNQSTLLKQWAFDGAKESASWDTPTADTENQPPLKATEEGFGSPILKARVPEKNDKPIGSPTASQQRKSRDTLVYTTRNNQPATHATQAQEQDKYHHKDARNTVQKPRTQTKKRGVATHSDSEVEMRLSERRQRKKLKRNIMSPAVSDNESQPEAKKGKQGKKAKKAPARTSPGFALMHGFSATNVGKNRLTLDRILQNAGVFGKGKASSATKVVKTGKPTGFSESDFLKKVSRTTRKTTGRKRSPPPSLVNSSSSSSSSFSSSIRYTHKVAKRQKKMRRPCSPTVSLDAPGGSRVSSLSTPTPVQTRPVYDPANSVEWDIEKDSHVAVPISKVGTVVVKVPHTLGRETADSSGPVKNRLTHTVGTEDLSNNLADPAHNLDTRISLDRSSMLSLGPSESASQPQSGKAFARQPQNVITSTSKYFRPADIPRELDPVHHLSSPSVLIYAPKSGLLSAPTQTVAISNDPDAFRSALEPTRDSKLDWEVTDCEAQDLGPMRHSLDEPCFWSQVGYDFDPQDEHSVFDNANVYLNDDYAISSNLSHCQEPDNCFPVYGMGPTSIIDDEPSFDDYDCGRFSTADPRLVLDMDLACEEDHTIFHDQDMEYITGTQTSGWTESTTLPVMEEHNRFDMAFCHDFSEDDMEEEIAATASSDLATGSAALVPFQQGRGLLRGFDIQSADNFSHSLSKTEAEVAGNLKRHHWVPQRF